MVETDRTKKGNPSQDDQLFSWRKYTGTKKEIGCTLYRLFITLAVAGVICMGLQIPHGIFSSGFAHPVQSVLAMIIIAIVIFLIGVIWARDKYTAHIIETIKESGDKLPPSLAQRQDDDEKTIPISIRNIELLANRKTNSRYVFHIVAFIAGLIVVGSIVWELSDMLAPGSIAVGLLFGVPLICILLIGAALWMRLRNKEIKAIKKGLEGKLPS